MSSENPDPDISPQVLARPEHTLSRSQISSNALKVMYRLHRAGYLAYLVGGGVRDLLLEQTPKDFDIGTNARPQEVRRLFSNSRIIGRRFRLAHILFREEIVEVSTFRASPDPPEVPGVWDEEQAAEERDAEHAEPVVELPVDNNVFGTPAEDARRRDFTVNALFYNIADFSIIDHVGGIADLEARLLRTIGDPDERFEEDPVRMMRALEYQVRLDLELEPETEAAIHRCHHHIASAAPARLSYELLEGLRSGHAAGIYNAWMTHGLFDRAFPDLPAERSAQVPVLEIVDRLTAAGKPLSDAGLLGAIFLPQFMAILNPMLATGERLNNVALLQKLREMLGPASARMHIANRNQHIIHHALFTITKLRRPLERARQVLKLVRQDYFPVAWSLFSLAVEMGLMPDDSRRSWARALAQVARGEAPEIEKKARRPRRRRPRRKRSEQK